LVDDVRNDMEPAEICPEDCSVIVEIPFVEFTEWVWLFQMRVFVKNHEFLDINSLISIIINFWKHALGFDLESQYVKQQLEIIFGNFTS
jgi:hypothetical protein